MIFQKKVHERTALTCRTRKSFDNLEFFLCYDTKTLLLARIQTISTFVLVSTTELAVEVLKSLLKLRKEIFVSKVKSTVTNRNLY